jgi:hypothetical protein
VPDRPIEVRTTRSGGACIATATATVAETPVSLFNVHARLRRLFGVESITIRGRDPESGSVVQEILKP